MREYLNDIFNEVTASFDNIKKILKNFKANIETSLCFLYVRWLEIEFTKDAIVSFFVTKFTLKNLTFISLIGSIVYFSWSYYYNTMFDIVFIFLPSIFLPYEWILYRPLWLEFCQFVVLFKSSIFFWIIFFIGFWKALNIGYTIKYVYLKVYKKRDLNSFQLYCYRQDVKRRLNNSLKMHLFRRISWFKRTYLFSHFFIYLFKYFKLGLNYIWVLILRVIVFFRVFVFRRTIDFSKKYFFILTRNLFVFWRPLFKRWSYFGLYRSYRSKWLKKN